MTTPAQPLDVPLTQRPGFWMLMGCATVLFAAFVTQVGALSTATILIALVTSYLAVEAVKHLIAGRAHDTAASGT